MSADVVRTAQPPAAPSRWIAGYSHLVPVGARVLDVACGSGRHARLFAARGCRVLAVDRDASVLAGMDGVAGIETRCEDLERGSWPLAAREFDAIIVTNYLFRPLLPHLLGALAADGAMLYETFARGNEAYGRPSNPDYLLEPGELLRYAERRLTVIAFEQGRVDDAGRVAVVQRLAAVGMRRKWPPALCTR